MLTLAAQITLVLATQQQNASILSAITGPVIAMGSIGLLLGLGLAFAAKKFAVQKDPRVEAILEVLPSANCGGCGYPGCAAFAIAVVEGNTSVSGCTAASSVVNAAIAKIMGTVAEEKEKMVATILCNGGKSAVDAFNYSGPSSCVSISMVMGGQKACTYGCLGSGDCIDVCPFDAMTMGDNGIPLIDSDKCVACGKCVDVCPRNIITLWPVSRKVVIACSSKDKGGVARKACSVACIGCRKCAKVCPADAVIIDGFLARINPDKCINCGLCASECPTGAIIDGIPVRPKAFIDTTCIGCTLCTRVCPTDAIEGSLKEKHTVIADKCIGCGQCVEKCPKKSIKMMGGVLSQQ
ncbi:MAG: RnfABCDGE type electron transport complex subunit B [Candidatus Sabulitectum sp.]|nr:RnfABCDGE type electron transport complex subunit B [Candidatus Sabulitectum sp.]